MPTVLPDEADASTYAGEGFTASASLSTGRIGIG
jgi:hypothetical protein